MEKMQRLHIHKSNVLIFHLPNSFAILAAKKRAIELHQNQICQSSGDFKTFLAWEDFAPFMLCICANQSSATARHFSMPITFKSALSFDDKYRFVTLFSSLFAVSRWESE